ncbi:hypothetical protein MXD81_55175, partial [Microbacteriaceae bacterium K1510]|nr:hypothetical protein [Microbacteriaceae bacterium K1510]
MATKNMPRRFQIWAWVGAAGFLLAVGAFAMNGLQGVPGGSNVALNDAASGSSNTSPAGSTGANQTYSAETQANQAIAMAPEVQNQGTAETPKDSVTPDTAKAVEPASALAPQPAKAEQPVADQQAAPASPAHNKAGTNGGQQPPQAKSPAVSSPQAKEAQGIAHNRPLIAARNKNQPASAPAAANQQPPAAITALGEPVKNPAEAKAGEPASDKGIALTAPEANDPAANSATSSAANNQTNGVAESGSTNAPVIYPQAPKQPITLSTFTDVGTAVQAS